MSDWDDDDLEEVISVQSLFDPEYIDDEFDEWDEDNDDWYYEDSEWDK